MTAAAIDNDILYKGAWFGLLPQMVGAISADLSDVAVLGHARFVLRKRLSKDAKRGLPGAETALSRLAEFLSKVTEVEPSTVELQLAADLENDAQARGLALDSGESLLCAIVVTRTLDYLATGDKRAITALEHLATGHPKLVALQQRVVCLEQLLKRLLSTEEPAQVRIAICGASQADITSSICFNCAGGAGTVHDWVSCLDSYLKDLRNNAPRVLAP